MAPRRKKLIGLSILVPGLALYLFFAAALGERVPPFWLLRALYYLAAGLAWTIPAAALLRWIDKDASRNEP